MSHFLPFETSGGFMVILYEAVHCHLYNSTLLCIICQLRAFHQDAADRITETRKIVQVFGQSLEQRVIFR